MNLLDGVLSCLVWDSWWWDLRVYFMSSFLYVEVSFLNPVSFYSYRSSEQKKGTCKKHGIFKPCETYIMKRDFFNWIFFCEFDCTFDSFLIRIIIFIFMCSFMFVYIRMMNIYISISDVFIKNSRFYKDKFVMLIL